MVAAALAACNPFLVWYSQEFRPYIADGAAQRGRTARVRLCARATDRPRAGGLGDASARSGLANHYYALLVVVPEAVWLLLVHRRNRAGCGWRSRSSAPVGLGLLPLAISQNSTGNASWIAPIPLVPRLGADRAPSSWSASRRPRPSCSSGSAEASRCWWRSSLLALRSDRVERQRRAGGGRDRGYGLHPEPADDRRRRRRPDHPQPARAVAAGRDRRRRRTRRQRAGWIGILTTAAVCVTGIVAVVGVDTHARLPASGLARGRGACSALSRRRGRRARDARPGLPRPAAAVAVRARPALPATPARLACTELDVVSIKAPRVPLCWWGAACNLSGSTMQRDYGFPGFHVVWRRRALQFTVLRLVSSRPGAAHARDRRRGAADDDLPPRRAADPAAVVSARSSAPSADGRRRAPGRRARAGRSGPARARGRGGRRARTSA